MLIHGYSTSERKLNTLPSVISGRRVNLWTEDNVVSFLNRLG